MCRDLSQDHSTHSVCAQRESESKTEAHVYSIEHCCYLKRQPIGSWLGPPTLLALGIVERDDASGYGAQFSRGRSEARVLRPMS